MLLGIYWRAPFCGRSMSVEATTRIRLDGFRPQTQGLPHIPQCSMLLYVIITLGMGTHLLYCFFPIFEGLRNPCSTCLLRRMLIPLTTKYRRMLLGNSYHIPAKENLFPIFVVPSLLTRLSSVL